MSYLIIGLSSCLNAGFAIASLPVEAKTQSLFFRPDRPLGEAGLDRTPFSYQELITAIDRAGVDRAILVPPSFDKDRNDYAIEAVQKHPDCFAIMGRVPLQSGGGRNLLTGWKNQPGMLGVRLTFHRDADRPWIDDGTADWFWVEAEENRIPVMVHAPERLPVVGEVAARHPALRIIVDHMGFARATMDEEAMAGADRMIALAPHPNVYVKVSALPCFPPRPIRSGTCASRCAASSRRSGRNVRSGAATSPACRRHAATGRR